MEEIANFNAISTEDNRVHFIKGKITITANHCLYNNGKHQITDPHTANANFVCCGKTYTVANTENIPTVEDWYLKELLPKFQMLYLLETVMP